MKFDHLLPGLTIEDMKLGMSKIRNHVIARLFRELDMIEQWGTGIRRIFQEAAQQGLPEPEIIETGMRVRILFILLKRQVLNQPNRLAVMRPTNHLKQKVAV